MSKVLIFLSLCAAIFVSVAAVVRGESPNRVAPKGTWQAMTLDGRPYFLLLPHGYDPRTQRYPLLLFLHGQGDDVANPSTPPGMADRFFNSPAFRGTFPAIVVAPQCVGSTNPAVCSWGGSQPYERNGEVAALAITKNILSQYAVDEDRVYVTGISLGGNGVWDMIWRYNHVFAAALPVAGATWYWRTQHAPDLVTTPIWVAHGELDSEVPPTYDRGLFAAIRDLGGKQIRYTEYPGKGHDVWDEVYTDERYFEWLFAQRLSNRTDLVGPTSPVKGTTDSGLSRTCGTHAGPIPWQYCITKTIGSRSQDVVYHLHGAGENVRAWTELEYGREVSARWRHDHRDSPILVTVSFGPFWMLTARNGAPQSGLADYFLGNVIPTVEANLLGVRVHKRKLLGVSIGGFNAATLMLLRPDMFSAVALQCPALLRLSPYTDEASLAAYIARSPGGKPDWIREMVRQGAPYYPNQTSFDRTSPLPFAKLRLNRSSPPLFVSCGDVDEFGLAEGAKDLVGTATAAGVRTRWVPVKGGHCVMDYDSLARFLIEN